MRVGYLYGPQSRDLALYETSFKRFRPYYAGPEEHRGNFVHFADAARAAVLAGEKQPANVVVNVVDGTAVSFGTFIDTFAQALGRKKPRRIPTWAVRFAPLITPQQVKQLKLRAAQVDNSRARNNCSTGRRLTPATAKVLPKPCAFGVKRREKALPNRRQ